MVNVSQYASPMDPMGYYVVGNRHEDSESSCNYGSHYLRPIPDPNAVVYVKSPPKLP